MPDFVHTDIQNSPSGDAIAFFRRSVIPKISQGFMKIGYYGISASLFGMALEILTIPLIWFPEFNFMPRTNLEGNFVPYIGIFSIMSFMISLLIFGVSDSIKVSQENKAIEAWVKTLPRPSDDLFMVHVRRMIVEKALTHDIESIPSEENRLYIHRMLSNPNPTDNDLRRLADILSIKKLIPNRLSNGIQNLSKTGILVDRQEIAALIRRIDFDIEKVDFRPEDIPYLAEIMRARFYSDQILDALLSGNIGTDEATQRLSSFACLIDGAAEAIGLQLSPNTSVVLPRPELVDV